MVLILDEHDQAIVTAVFVAIRNAVLTAHNPVAPTKRIGALATGLRNIGQGAAIKRYPFKAICEASGMPLDQNPAQLDEMEPELGYSGKLRWVCQRANNSGKHTCGGC